MPDPKIFTTPSRQKTPVPSDLLEHLGSPLRKEAWYREAASIEQQVLNLLSLFERDQISKGEYLHRMRKIFRPGAEPPVTDLIQEGGVDPWGEKVEGLYFTPAFGDWAMSHFQEWQQIYTDVSRGYDLKMQELGKTSRNKPAAEDPITFDQFRNTRYPSSNWAPGIIGYTMGAVESPRRDYKVLVPQDKESRGGHWAPRDAETPEEFMKAYKEAWSILRILRDQYIEYLEGLTESPE